MTRHLLRAVAIAIAVAAVIDPPVTMTARGRPRLALLASGGGQNVVQGPAIERVARRLRSELEGDFAGTLGRDTDAPAAVVIGQGYPDEPLPAGQRVFTVSTGPAANDRSVRIAAVRAPRAVPRGTLIHLEVDIDAAHAAGTSSSVVVRAGDARAEVARASHTWTANERRWRAALDVTPLDVPPWALRVEVGEPGIAGDGADVMVDLAEPLRVFMYEPRPAWASAFVRRALESDSRFAVGSRALPSRGVTVTAGSVVSLEAAALERVQVVIVGGLDRLTAGEATVLERFMRDREGAVVLLPDSRADASRMRDWFLLGEATEVLLEKSARLATEPPLPPIEASEMLTFRAGPGDAALARAPGSREPVVVVSPHGGGRLLASGALDAWRYRAGDAAAFDRFWQSAIAGLALASPPPIDARVEPPVVAPGRQAELIVRVRRAAAGLTAADAVSISAALPNGDPVRLWPDLEADTFRGSFTAPRTDGASHVTVAQGSIAATDFSPANTATARFIVVPDARTAVPSSPLTLLSQSRGGIDVSPDDLSDLVRALRAQITAPPTRVERRPMRSIWWLLPFAGCLSGEWWLRRRRGLR